MKSATESRRAGSTIAYVARRLEKKRLRAQPPRIDSFSDFLTQHARVKSGSGYVPYHFTGREALRPIVDRLDLILASGESDASLAICGGAQFGKTVLMLNLLAYLVAVRFRNVGYYLPDDDLVSGLVDGKLRPDVLDQIPWLARLIAVGKTLNASGRAVNRKGAFLCTDGTQTALAFMRGLGKIPTSFSMDVVVQDEKDDLPEEHARFLAGRMTASSLRLSLLIGTQRYHGAGQNLAFTEGTQHIGLVRCKECGARVNPETAWPGVCRLVAEGRSSRDWPRLTGEGHFSFERGREGRFLFVQKDSGRTRAISSPGHQEGEGHFAFGRGDGTDRTEGSLLVGGPDNLLSGWPQATRGHREYPPSSVTSCSLRESGQRVVRTTGEEGTGAEPAPASLPIPFAPGQEYSLCCPDCGALLDRENPEWHALAPEREAQRRWSFRLSQLLIPAIDLGQIVAAWQLAIRDPDHMTVFCTDRLALPKSTTQALTPGILEAARGDYTLPEVRAENADRTAFSLLGSDFMRFGGLDMGDQCWFVARAVDVKAPHVVRFLWAEPIAAERVRSRVPELFRQLGLSALCVDAGPLRDLARDLVFMLNEGSRRAPRAGATSGGPDNSLSGWPQATRGHRWHSSSPATSCSLRESGQRVVRTTDEEGTGAGPAPATLPIPVFHERTEKWRNVRAMAVEFTQREGMGLRHKIGRTVDGREYPLLAANRDETIDRVVQELLPPGVGDARLIELPDGTAATAATQRFFLPRATEETRSVLDVYERHLLAGTRRERSVDGRSMRYLDKCENHFLLATAYAALAEFLAPRLGEISAVPAFRGLPTTRGHARRERSVIG